MPQPKLTLYPWDHPFTTTELTLDSCGQSQLRITTRITAHIPDAKPYLEIDIQLPG
jgi:hypothetical protein